MMLEAVSSILKGASDLAQSSSVARSSSAITQVGQTAQSAQSAVGFDGVLQQVANDAISTMKTGEAASISYIQGKVSAQSVWKPSCRPSRRCRWRWRFATRSFRHIKKSAGWRSEGLQ